jgi:uncharacterized membrane protein YkoI
MNKFKMSLLIVSLLVVGLGGIVGKLAIANRIPGQSARVSGSSVAIVKTQKTPDNSIATQATTTHWRSKITFPEALRIAEAAMGGKAYNVERETEGGRPVIEVGIDEKEVFVDAESGKIVSIDNLRRKGDREDIKDSTEAIKLQQLATITIQEALQAGETFAGKQAYSVELKNKDGNLVYEVVVGLQEVFIDAGNRQVLSTEPVGQPNENDAPQFSSSIQIPSAIAP